MSIYSQLRNEYHRTCGHNRIYRIICVSAIKLSYRSKSDYTYIKSILEKTKENKLNRNFNSDKPNEKECTDITEIKISVTGRNYI